MLESVRVKRNALSELFVIEGNFVEVWVEFLLLFKVIKLLLGGWLFFIPDKIVKMIVNGDHSIFLTDSNQLKFRLVESESHFLDRTLVSE